MRFPKKEFLNQRAQAWAFCLLTASLLVACSTPPPQLPHLSSQGKILAFGDSLTYGTGAKPATSYPAVLQTLISHEVINAGIPGETTAQGLKRLPGVLQKTQPELVILCLGGNDFLRRQDAAQTRDNLAAMIDIIQQHGAAVMLLAVPRPKLLLSDEPLYKELAERYQIPLADDVLTGVLGDKTLKSDSVHPNASGYRRIASEVATFLEERGAI